MIINFFVANLHKTVPISEFKLTHFHKDYSPAKTSFTFIVLIVMYCRLVKCLNDNEQSINTSCTKYPDDNSIWTAIILSINIFFLFCAIICNYILHKERKSPNFGSRKLTCCCLCRRLYGDSSTRCQYLASRVTLPPFTRLNPTVNPSKRGSEYL